MQLAKIKEGWKPITMAAGLIVGETMGLYADFDLYSSINTVINNHETAQYIREVNNPADIIFNDKRRFLNHYNSWRNDTKFLSSIRPIIGHDDFKAIVAMGNRAVPFILDEIEARPSNLVWALNLIFQRKITNRQDVTVTDACRLWIKALR